MHTAFLLIQKRNQTNRSSVSLREKGKTMNTQTNQNKTTKEARENSPLTIILIQCSARGTSETRATYQIAIYYILTSSK